MLGRSWTAEHLIMPGIIEHPKLVQDAMARYGDLFANECQRRHLAEYLTGRSCLFSLRLVFVIFGRSSRFRVWTPVTTQTNGFGNWSSRTGSRRRGFSNSKASWNGSNCCSRE